MLDQVLQIGLEFHQVPDNIRHFSTLVRDLYGLGFKIIAWDPNLETHLKSGLYEYFEVVFRKTEICLRD